LEHREKDFTMKAFLVALLLGVVSTYLAAADGKNNFFAVDYPFEFVPPSTYATDLDAMKAAGVQSIRVTIHWKRIARSEGNYDFSALDSVIEAVRARGIEVFATFVNVPGWATNSKGALDLRKLDQFEAFVRRSVRRYKTQIREWEIWNEPNNTPFWAGSAQDYVQLLKTAYTAIKSEDPTALVIGISSGSLGTLARPDRWRFVHEVLENGAGKYLDAVSVHPYRNLYGPDIRNSPGKFAAKWTQREEISRLGELLAQFALRREIYITELGWSDINGEKLQAAYLVRAYVSMFAEPSVKRLAWFYWRDGTYKVANFGLVRNDMQPKLALHAFRNIRLLLDTSIPQEKRIDDNLILYRFQKAGRSFWVAWSPDNKARKFARVALVGKTRVREMDLYTENARASPARNPLIVTRDPLVLMAQ